MERPARLLCQAGRYRRDVTWDPPNPRSGGWELLNFHFHFPFPSSSSSPQEFSEYDYEIGGSGGKQQAFGSGDEPGELATLDSAAATTHAGELPSMRLVPARRNNSHIGRCQIPVPTSYRCDIPVYGRERVRQLLENTPKTPPQTNAIRP